MTAEFTNSLQPESWPRSWRCLYRTGRLLGMVAEDVNLLEIKQERFDNAKHSLRSTVPVKFLAYKALEENRASMPRFGTGIKPIEAIAWSLI